jgi:hypothetical protein
VGDSAGRLCKSSLAMLSTAAACLSRAGCTQRSETATVEWPISLMIVNASALVSGSHDPRARRRAWRTKSFGSFSRRERILGNRDSRIPAHLSIACQSSLPVPSRRTSRPCLAAR